MTPIPIVFIHKTNSYYLKYAINQACSFNEKVYLLGDTSNQMYKNTKFQHFLIKDYVHYNNQLKNYLHLSSNPLDFEFFCIERWFVLRDFMKHNNINKVVYVDSDVLLFCDCSDFFNSYYEGGICVPFQTVKTSLKKNFGAASAHVSYWTLELLEEFCEFVSNCYMESNILATIQTMYCGIFLEENKEGGICDMTFLYMFYINNSHRVENLLEIKDNSCVEDNINSSTNLLYNEYATNKNRYLKFLIHKKIEIINGLPFVYNLYTKHNIQFKALHCQGRAKLLMPLFSIEKASILRYAIFRHIRFIFFITIHFFNLKTIYKISHRLWKKLQ